MNHDFFDVIDTQEKAYVLGFFYSDGCNATGNNAVRLGVTDKDILLDIQKSMGHQGKLHSQPNGVGRKELHSLVINSERLSNGLEALGCTSNKSLTLTFPAKEQVPINLHHHLIRGWLDGDGCITFRRIKKYNKVYCHVEIVGTKHVCKGIWDSVRIHTGVEGKVYRINREGQNELWEFCVDRQSDIRIFLEWLYRDATIYLDRKFNRYVEACQLWGVEPVSTSKPLSKVPV